LGISGFSNDGLWRSAPMKTIRDKMSGYRVELDLRKSTERGTYFLGRYVSLDVLKCLQIVLRPGTCFLDGGSNIGLVALYAARLVGPTGRVMAFEPNPAVFARLSRHIVNNGLQANIALYPYGLGDAEQSLALKVINDSSETGTLAEDLPDNMKRAVTSSVLVPVRRADAVLAPQFDRIRSLVVKLDIEGFELPALRGMNAMVERFKPVILTEVHKPKMAAAHASVEDLFDWMSARGYQAFVLGLARSLRGRRLHLRRASTADVLPDQCDLLWLLPDHMSLFSSDTRDGRRCDTPAGAVEEGRS